MTQKEKNLQAVDTYMERKVFEVDNGNTRIFRADVSYFNKKTRKTTIRNAVQVSVSTIVFYGGYVLSISDLQDEEGCFVEHNTNFNEFTFANGQLTIKGKDNTGNKGDYVLVVS